MEKHLHFISIIAASGESTVFDIELTTEQYELINRISALSMDSADTTEPVLAISKIVDELPTSEMPIIKPRG